MTELIKHDGDLATQMDYARTVSTAALLPQAYRGKPADILIAMGLGRAMGLTPEESLYRIDVIQGKPTASAELIAANVRKAGHKLRVRVDEQAVSATATIIRADDPEFEHTVTRDAAWAKQMGLTGKDNYKKQPVTMLQWRAITAVARQACPEALYGVSYTPDEMVDLRPATPPQTMTVESFQAAPEPAADVTDAETVEDITKEQAGRLGELLKAAGMGSADAKDEALAYYEATIGRRVESTKDLTAAEADQVIAALQAQPEADFWAGEQA